MRQETKHVYEFGPYRLDTRERLLLRDSESLPLTPKQFDLLLVLVENQRHVLERDVLIKKVWPDTFVEEGNLSKVIFGLRRILGEGYIETLPRRGYRFVAEVRAVEGDREKSEAGGSASGRNSASALTKMVVGAGVVAAMAMGTLFSSRNDVKAGRLSPVEYVQLTNFTDPVTAPAISADGRMLAFLRSDTPFLSNGQIYLKTLPNGEPIQLTHSPRPKFGPSFSPDGSRVAFTIVEPHRGGWNTWTVPAAGGEPQLLLSNASGLTWTDEGQVLFSGIRKGMHMGIVAATESRTNPHDVYFPEHERAMAHYSYASPDRRWALVVEMDRTASFQPCRLVPFDGRSLGRQVGPRGACMSAGWSPDGRWMYFTVLVEGSSHLWRQRFPAGAPEQITFGPMEEEGVAVEPDGRSVISSIGLRQSAIWIHESERERSISLEGYATQPAFSSDCKTVYYLLQRRSLHSSKELWRTELASGKSEGLLPGFSVTSYHVSTDQREILFNTTSDEGQPEVWLGSVDRSLAPRRLLSSGEDSVGFGASGQIIYRSSEGRKNYLYQIRRDGTARNKIRPDPISTVHSISPDGRWVVALVPVRNEELGVETLAIPTQGGSPRRICPGYCIAFWSADGRYFFIRVEQATATAVARTIALPTPPGETLPDLPSGGIQSAAEGSALAGALLFERAAFAAGSNPSTYAYAKTNIYRNLFRIPLP